jgi:predicted peptidase
VDKNSFTSPLTGLKKIRHLFELLPIYIGWYSSQLQPSGKDEYQQAVNLAVADFQQFKFSDPGSGLSLKYNLFIPREYKPNKSYPLVLFIHDLGSVSPFTRTTLIQGQGATIWATASEQAKHECFILAPQYASAIVNDDSEASMYLDATANLIKYILDRYPIDTTRVYTTGQSMGCMASIELLIRNPNLFAAALLVAGQWDAEKMSVLTKAKMWIVVAEGDLRAFPGMNASLASLEAGGAKVSRATWNGRAGGEELTAAVNRMASQSNPINYAVLAKGTVVPPGLPESGLNNHIHTWPIVYSIEGLRDWLFSQAKS